MHTSAPLHARAPAARLGSQLSGAKRSYARSIQSNRQTSVPVTAVAADVGKVQTQSSGRQAKYLLRVKKPTQRGGPQISEFLKQLAQAQNLQQLVSLHARVAAKPTGLAVGAMLRRLVALMKDEEQQGSWAEATRLASNLLSSTEAVLPTMTFRDSVTVLLAVQKLRLTVSQALVRQLAATGLERLQARPTAADMARAPLLLSSLTSLGHRPTPEWLRAYCSATEQQLPVMELRDIAKLAEGLAQAQAEVPTSYLRTILYALQSLGPAAVEPSAMNTSIWRNLRHLRRRPLPLWREHFSITTAIWRLQDEAPEEAKLLDTASAASTWQQVCAAVQAAPPAAVTPHSLYEVVMLLDLLMRQQHHAKAMAVRRAALASGEAADAGNEEDEVDDGEGADVEAELRWWLGELGGMWSESWVQELQGIEAATLLKKLSFMGARMDVGVVQRLVGRYLQDSQDLWPPLAVSVLSSMWRLGSAPEQEQAAVLLQRTEDAAPQLRAQEVVLLVAVIVWLGVEVADSLVEALVARCQALVPWRGSPGRRARVTAALEAVRKLRAEPLDAWLQQYSVARIIWPQRDAEAGASQPGEERPQRDAEAFASQPRQRRPGGVVPDLRKAASWQQVEAALQHYSSDGYAHLPAPVALAALTQLVNLLQPASSAAARDKDTVAEGEDAAEAEAQVQQTETSEDVVRDPRLGALLAALGACLQQQEDALRAGGFRSLNPQALRRLVGVPGVYHSDVRTAATTMLGVVLACPEADSSKLRNPGRIGCLLYASVQLQLELSKEQQGQLRQRLLDMLPQANSLAIYWAVRALSAGAVGAADEEMVGAILKRLDSGKVGGERGILRAMAVPEIDIRPWLQQSRAARRIWGRITAKDEPARRNPTSVHECGSWGWLARLMDEAAEQGRPWDGPTCCAAMTQLAIVGAPRVGSESVAVRAEVEGLGLRVLQHLSRQEATCTSGQLGGALAAAGRLQLQPAAGIVDTLVEGASSRASSWEDSVAVLEGLGRLGYFPGNERMAVLLEPVQRSMSSMPMDSVAGLLQSCSSLAYCPDGPVLTTALDQVRDRAEELSSRAVCELLFSLAKLDQHPEDAVMGPLLQRLDEVYHDMGIRQRGRVLWALQQLGFEVPAGDDEQSK